MKNDSKNANQTSAPAVIQDVTSFTKNERKYVAFKSGLKNKAVYAAVKACGCFVQPVGKEHNLPGYFGLKKGDPEKLFTYMVENASALQSINEELKKKESGPAPSDIASLRKLAGLK